MSYVPHPDTEPLVKRPAREIPGESLDDEAERNLSSRLEPSNQGSDTPGLREAPPSELTDEQVEDDVPESNPPSKDLRQVLHEAEIESGGPMTDEARRQLEQNSVRQENYP